MSARRTLTILALVGMLACWPVVAHTAASQPERRSATSHSPTAAAAAVSVEADFDNDGFADLAVGVPSEGVGAASQAGAVNVLYGAASGLTASGNQQWLQGSGGIGGVAEEGDFVGAALSTGDYDNDTFADLATGAPFEDIGTLLDAGAINTVYGSASGLSATDAQQFFQGNGGVAGTPEEGDAFGSALA